MSTERRFGWFAGAITALATLTTSATHAQVFDEIVDTPDIPETAYDVAETRAGGYITAGSRGSAGALDIQVINYAPDGTIIWEFIFDVGMSDDAAYSVVQSGSGDFIVAGHTDAATLSGISAKEVFVMRLDVTGALIWFYVYDGTIGTDPIHVPDPGPSVIETSSGDIAFIANLGGSPIYTYLDPSGAVLGGAVYFPPPGLAVFAVAFTDLKEFADTTIGISGSISTTFPAGTAAPPSIRPLFVRIEPVSALIIGLASYGILPPLCSPTDPTYDDGLGLAIRDDQLVYLTGKTDLGASFLDPMTGLPVPGATHLLLIDPFPPVPPAVAASVYDPNFFNSCSAVDPEMLVPSYATIDADRLNLDAIIGLTYTSPGTLPPPLSSATALLVTDSMLIPKFLFHYLENTANEAAIRHYSTCGYALAGSAFLFFPPAPPFFSDAIHLVKTDDFGATFCTERDIPALDEPISTQLIQLNLQSAPIMPEIPFTPIQNPGNAIDDPICRTPDCVPTGACCYACPATGGGPICLDLPSAADCAALSGCWQGLGTSCTDPGICPCPADVNCDGIVNLADFNILGINFNAGPGATRSQGDLNCDGFVNLADFNVLGIGFGCM